MALVGLGVEVVPVALAVEPGAVGAVQVRVRNAGAEPCEVTVEVAGDASHWTWAHPATCPVAAGADAQVAVFFKPPCGPVPAAGMQPFEVRAVTADGEVGVGGGEVDVRPYVDIVASLDPPATRDKRGSTFTLRFENRGNVATSASLRGDDLLGLLDVSVEPRSVTAGPGETATATVRVEARKALKGNGERRLPFVVHAECDGCAPLRADGSLYQLGRKAPAPVA